MCRVRHTPPACLYSLSHTLKSPQSQICFSRLVPAAENLCFSASCSVCIQWDTTRRLSLTLLQAHYFFLVMKFEFRLNFTKAVIGDVIGFSLECLMWVCVQLWYVQDWCLQMFKNDLSEQYYLVFSSKQKNTNTRPLATGEFSRLHWDQYLQVSALAAPCWSKRSNQILSS